MRPAPSRRFPGRLAVLAGCLLLGLARGSPGADPLCAVHGVLEVVCTRCHPKLAVIFKAKGDWCAEHQFPESFCPVCKPAAGGRPQVNVSEDRAPATGTRVKLRSPEVAEAVGIQVARVESYPLGSFLTAVARITFDATRVASVSPRNPGVVRDILVDVGSRVLAGDALATIESASSGAEISRLQAARARQAVATANRDRERQLVARGLGVEQDRLAAEQEWAAAKAEVDTARAAVRQAGDVGPGGLITLASPRPGIVTRRGISIGQMASTDDPAFLVVDNSVVWAELEIAETDLAAVTVGREVRVAIDILPGKEFAGQLTYLAPDISEDTRTVLGRVVLQNSEGVLRANMFGTAKVATAGARPAVGIPRAALQSAPGASIAFVRTAPGEYETRRLEVGKLDAEKAEIFAGLSVGEEVVTTGSFLLKTETLKDSIGAGCCEAPKED